MLDEDIITETLEGTTRLFVPRSSLTDAAPPHNPAFYNPRAKLNRDISVIACAAFAQKFDGDALVLESHAGLGARGLRIANEVDKINHVILNDLNPTALELATRSAKLNSCEKIIETSENEACRFLLERAKQGRRGLIVDVDPFGSPSRYVDCAIRTCAHGGLLSITATDLQVLHGLFPDACFRRYGGVPIRRTPHSKEIALRLMLGCVRTIAARMDVTIIPVFCETDMHYYRIYMTILNKTDTMDNLGMIYHCQECARRGICNSQMKCECGVMPEFAGPLWTGSIFDAEFTKSMESAFKTQYVDAKCAQQLLRASAESSMPACYYTLDEIASHARISPPRLERALSSLESAGYTATPTSLDPTGFRTSATMPQIIATLG